MNILPDIEHKTRYIYRIINSNINWRNLNSVIL